MKSIDMICQALSGTGSGCKSLGDLDLSGLDCWQTEHDWTNCLTEVFVPFQAK
jgi:hypothetical protein